MRNVIAIICVIAALAAYVVLGGAESYAIGKMTLSGAVLEIDGQSISATGKAVFVSDAPNGSLKPDTMRVDSLRAESIRLTLIKGADKQRTLKEATASGGVTIRGKRSERTENESGTPTTTIQDFVATAQTATLAEGRDTVVLTGDAGVKVTEPGVPDPIWELSGKKITISLKDNKMRVEGQSDKPAALTVTPKEEKKQ